MKAVNARTINPTNNGFLFGQALSELWLHEELELVPVLTSLPTSMETEKENIIIIFTVKLFSYM